MPPSTQRLWLTEPRRKTSLAEVLEVQGNAFRLDRSLFRPKSRRYLHPQRSDRGTIWVKGGDKHRLRSSFWRGDEPWHRLDGPPPSVGATLQCHLDQERRSLDSRCHTAMHLLLAAATVDGEVELAKPPQVKGGGRFRLDVTGWHLQPDRLAAWLERVNQWVEQDLVIEHDHLLREWAHEHLTPQPIRDQDPYPGPDTTLEVVRIPEVCAYPCDGTHAARTSELGRVVVRQAQPTGGGTVTVIGEVPREAP